MSLDVKQSCQWIGKRIRWRMPSYRRVAPGKWSNEREGLCLAFIPSKTSLKENWHNTTNGVCIHPELENISVSQLKTGYGWGKSVNHRVLVRVDRVGGKGQALKPHYYAPRLSSVLDEVASDE